MPTIVKLFPTGDDTNKDSTVMAEEKEDVRKAVLEFMISLSEAKPGMLRRDGWAAAIVRVCLEEWASSAMTTSMFVWKLTFILLNFSVVQC
jgi:hypothetical protein